MRHPVSIVLVVLLVLSLPVSAVGTVGTAGSAGATTATQDGDDESTFQFRSPAVTVRGDHAQLDGTPNRLVLDYTEKRTYATPAVDFGRIVADQGESLHTDYRTFAFETEFEELEGEENRSEAAIRELERIEQRIEDLHEREQTIVAAHAAGEASDQELLRTLAKNFYEARELQRALARMNELDDDLVVDEHDGDTVEVSNVVNNLNSELDVYTGPIRESVNADVRGHHDDEKQRPSLVSIESSDEGLVLSMIDGDEYVREAVRYDNRDRTETEPRTDLGGVYDDVKEIYPWLVDNNGVSVTPNHLINLYTTSIEHDQGRIVVTLDSKTDQIYHERQYLELDRLPINAEKRLHGENVTAVLQSTPGIGPMKVTAVDTNTGEPTPASISIGEQPASETSADGEYWFVPPSDEFGLTVQTESESLNATVTASR